MQNEFWTFDAYSFNPLRYLWKILQVCLQLSQYPRSFLLIYNPQTLKRVIDGEKAELLLRKKLIFGWWFWILKSINDKLVLVMIMGPRGINICQSMGTIVQRDMFILVIGRIQSKNLIHIKVCVRVELRYASFEEIFETTQNYSMEHKKPNNLL